MSDSQSPLVNESVFKQNLIRRHYRGKWWGRFFIVANIIAIIALTALFINIVNQSLGLVAMQYKVPPETLSDRPLKELSEVELVAVLAENVPNRVRVIIRDELSAVDPTDFTTAPLSEVLAGKIYPANRADILIIDLTVEEQLALLSDNLSQEEMYEIIMQQIVQPSVVSSWRLFESLFERSRIEAEAAEKYPDAELVFRSWVNSDFVSNSVTSSATTAGLRTALLGSFWVIGITVAFAFPLGVGAAIYLEEYAEDTRLNRLIETNIRNLAGVPSIIYGMLGLAVFVRVLSDLTSGAVFGVADSNGRTVLSAGLTMALLILPVVIINAQEAIRAVPNSIREASYGIGATQWQTISRQVLPAALPGILTGVILSMSRAVGETAPLIVVGASTFIGIDPNGPFSKFTVVPIQIFQWTSRPELVFKNTAAAAIIVLLMLLLVFNGTAIIIRQRFSRRLQG